MGYLIKTKNKKNIICASLSYKLLDVPVVCLPHTDGSKLPATFDDLLAYPRSYTSTSPGHSSHSAETPSTLLKDYISPSYIWLAL